MKIQKCSCAEGIELLYSRITLVILLCILKNNYQNTLLNSQKTLCHWKKTTLPPNKGKRENDQKTI
jgi:hypothetical protein